MSALPKSLARNPLRVVDNFANVEALPQLVKRLRIERGLSQRDLADRAGYHDEILGRVEQGRGNFSARSAEAMLTALADYRPVTPQEAHDFLVGAGVHTSLNGELPRHVLHSLVRKGVIADPDNPVAPLAMPSSQTVATPAVVAAAPAHAFDEEILRAAARALRLLGRDRLLSMLNAIVPASDADPDFIDLVGSPVQKNGYTEQIIRTYERPLPPAPPSASSRRTAAG